jgi:hypothetical protein
MARQERVSRSLEEVREIGVVMSDYEQSGNRYTAIFLRREDGTHERMEYDLVRFNVDVNRDAPLEIVPCGIDGDNGKLFERIWVVNDVPWAKKVSFKGVAA